MKLVVLDRDGVINHDSVDYIRSVAQWRPLPGSVDAIARLSHAGHRVAIATNQSGIGRGLFGYHELAGIHREMLRVVALAGGRIDGVFFCPHTPDDRCDCRKPKAGLYGQIARYFGVSFDGVKSVGDSLRDLDAARAAGADPVLVRTGNGVDSEAQLGPEPGLPVFDDLQAFVANYLGS